MASPHDGRSVLLVCASMRTLMPSASKVPEAIRRVALHVFSEADAVALLEQMQRDRIEKYPISRLAQDDLGKALNEINWSSLHPRTLKRLIAAIPSIQMGYSGLATMGDTWPWWVASDVQERLRRQVAIEPDGEFNGSCDVFVPRADIDIDLSPSAQITNRAPGIAIECKALESLNALEKRIGKSAEQLEKYGSGVAAIDVSVALREACEKRGVSGFQNFHTFCERHLQDLSARAERYLEGEKKELKHLCGLFLHACVFSAVKHSVGVEGAYLVYQYRKIRAWTVGTPADPTTRLMLEQLAIMPPMLLYCAPPGKAFVTRSNTRLSMYLSAEGRDFSLKLDPLPGDLLVGPEIPMEILSSVVHGDPSQQTRDFLLEIERLDLPHPHDMVVRGGPRKTQPILPYRSRYKSRRKQSR